MTDPILIPVHYTDDMGSVANGHVEITPEIHDQILAPVMGRIADLEDHKHQMGAHGWTGEPMVKCDKDGAHVAADKPAPACDHKYMKLIVGIDQRTHRFCPDCGKEDQPAGDDAERAIAKIIEGTKSFGNSDFMPEGEAIIAAIRRGEVPGIRALSPCNPLIAEVADLRAKLADAQTHGKDMESMWDQNRHALTARVAELERERGLYCDILMTVCHALELPRCEDGPCEDALAYTRAIDGLEDENRLRSVMEQRDKALADLAADREKAAALDAERAARIASAHCDTNAARAEADALRAKLGEAADKFLSSAIKYDERCSQLVEALVQRDDARRERDALKARRVTRPEACLPSDIVGRGLYDGADIQDKKWEAAIRAAGVEVS